MKIEDIAFKLLDRVDMKTLVNSTASNWTITVPSRMTAQQAVALCRKHKASLIVCLNDEGVISGVVSTAHLREEIARSHQMSVRPFAETITFMLSNPAERRRGFRHEGLERRIYMYVCSVVPHYTTGDPCPEHNVPTKKRKFGDW